MKATFAGIEALERELAEQLRKVGQDIPKSFVAKSLRMIEAQTAPFVPVDTSALINSAVRKVVETNIGFQGELEYGGIKANDYALYVHEGPQKNWQKAGASNKYLEKGFRNFIEEDLQILIDDEFGEIGK